MSEFKFFCPQCGQSYKGDAAYAGREMQCVTCKSNFLITGAPGPKADATVMKPPTGHTWDTHIPKQAPPPGGLRLKPRD